MAKNNLAKFTILEALEDPRLLGAVFPSLLTWAAWIVWLKAIFALEMTAGEIEIYRKQTGRQNPPSKEPKEIDTITGRRGGKSRFSSALAAYLSAFRNYSEYLAPGETAVCLVLARDREQARVVFNYIKAIFKKVPLLRKMVVAERADEIELSNGVTIMVKTSDFRTLRGLTVVCCIADEVAFWDNQGVNPDKEIFAAIRPAMVTIPNAKLIMITTAYAKAGEAYEFHKEHYGIDEHDYLVWVASTRDMNPTISQEFIDKEIERDPDAAKAEWLGLFREDVEAAFSLELIEACVIPGRTEQAPIPEFVYKKFDDVSGGRGDLWATAIGHNTAGKITIDKIASWKPPFDPSVVTKESADIGKTYRELSTVGDKYAGEWPISAFAKEGVTYQQSERNKSEIYLEFLPLLTARQVELPDDKVLIKQLRQLERRKGRNGKDSIDHPSSGKDDVANSVAGVSVLLKDQPCYGDDMGISLGGGSRLDYSELSISDERPYEHLRDWRRDWPT